MLTALFFGFLESMFFWPAFIIGIIILCALSEHEEATWSAIVSITLLVLASFKFDFLTHAFDTWTQASLTVGIYIIVGVAWSAVKWALKARKIRTQFIDLRDSYLRKHCLPVGYFSQSETGTSHCKHHEDFADKIKSAMRDDFNDDTIMQPKTAQQALERVIPKISEHKKAVTMWVAYWPISITYFTLNDALREIAETIYNTISGTFQKLSDRMFKDIV